MNKVTEITGIQHNDVDARKVNYSAGEMRGEVSSQWFNRPDDQKFLDLPTLRDSVFSRYQKSQSGIIRSNEIEVIANGEDPNNLTLAHSQMGEVAPSHWSFGQACGLVKAPSSYLRTLPASLAGINLQYGLSTHRAERLQYYTADGQLHAATGADYGRVFDYEVVDAVMRLAGDGIGSTNWKVPGVMDWRTGEYDPNAPITRDSTTLFASDRDVFLFLVDDRNPIEIGKLPTGEPDLLFRGFYVWNSEVGSKSLGIATMYLRGVCQNRCLWGVEGYSQIRIRHSKGAPQRFIAEAQPTLRQFTDNNTRALIDGVQSAKDARVADDDDEARAFLMKQKFSKSKANEIVNRILDEEQTRPRSIWDMVQGITAVARDETHQDSRIQMERVAGKLLDKVA